MTGELTTMIAAMATLACLTLRSVITHMRAMLLQQHTPPARKFGRRAGDLDAAGAARPNSDIVWCVVGIGAHNDLLHHRVIAPSYDLAAAIALREVRGLHRVVGVSPVSVC